MQHLEHAEGNVALAEVPNTAVFGLLTASVCNIDIWDRERRNPYACSQHCSLVATTCMVPMPLSEVRSAT